MNVGRVSRGSLQSCFSVSVSDKACVPCARSGVSLKVSRDRHNRCAAVLNLACASVVLCCASAREQELDAGEAERRWSAGRRPAPAGQPRVIRPSFVCYLRC